MQYMLSEQNPCLVTEAQMQEAWKKVRCKRGLRRTVEKCIRINPQERIPDMYTLLRILRYFNRTGKRKHFEKRNFNLQLDFSQCKSIWKCSDKK